MHIIKVSKQICLLGLIEVSCLYFSALRELARLIHVQDVMKGFGYGCCVSSTTHKTAFPDLSLLLRKERVQLSVCCQRSKNYCVLSVFTSGSFVFQKRSYCNKICGCCIATLWCCYDQAFVFHMTDNCSVFPLCSECAEIMFQVCSFDFCVDIVFLARQHCFITTFQSQRTAESFPLSEGVA